jgi:ABC-type dipeptide/oligopeptide/nickel transport system ATPase subunit
VLRPQDTRRALNARKCIRQIPGKPLEHLGFLGTREAYQKLFNILKDTHLPALFYQHAFA